MEFAPADEPKSVEATDPGKPGVQWMIPQPDVRFRTGSCVVLLVLLAFSPGGIGAKVVGVATITFLVGSYRRSYLKGNSAVVRLTVCFVPLKRQKLRLTKYERIEIMLEEPAGWWSFFLLGPVYWLWMRALDFSIPWFGGIYQLWLSNQEDKVLVWQGYADEDFQHKLKALETATGLRAERTGGY